jgi:hypothetical protein
MTWTKNSVSPAKAEFSSAPSDLNSSFPRMTRHTCSFGSAFTGELCTHPSLMLAHDPCPFPAADSATARLARDISSFDICGLSRFVAPSSEEQTANKNSVPQAVPPKKIILHPTHLQQLKIQNPCAFPPNAALLPLGHTSLSRFVAPNFIPTKTVPVARNITKKARIPSKALLTLLRVSASPHAQTSTPKIKRPRKNVLSPSRSSRSLRLPLLSPKMLTSRRTLQTTHP